MDRWLKKAKKLSVEDFITDHPAAWCQSYKVAYLILKAGIISLDDLLAKDKINEKVFLIRKNKVTGEDVVQIDDVCVMFGIPEFDTKGVRVDGGGRNFELDCMQWGWYCVRDLVFKNLKKIKNLDIAFYKIFNPDFLSNRRELAAAGIEVDSDYDVKKVSWRKI